MAGDTMSDLSAYPLEDILTELKSRNLSFILAWVDHQQFTKDSSMAQEIVWGIDSGGNMILQEVLVKFINKWRDQLLMERTAPGREG